MNLYYISFLYKLHLILFKSINKIVDFAVCQCYLLGNYKCIYIYYILLKKI